MHADLIGLAAFLAVMTGTPGPANMLLVGAGARHGLRAALPFALGVILGMQIVAWPAGLGLLSLAGRAPLLYEALRWICAGYITWLAWRIAGARVGKRNEAVSVPDFWRGLLVHPLNPKAWAIAGGAFTQFLPPADAPWAATATGAILMLAVGGILQGAWFWAGSRMAGAIAGHALEPWVMRGLALLTIASVVAALEPWRAVAS